MTSIITELCSMISNLHRTLHAGANLHPRIPHLSKLPWPFRLRYLLCDGHFIECGGVFAHEWKLEGETLVFQVLTCS